MEKCYICQKGMLKKKTVPYKLYGESIGNFQAEVCETCGEIFFSEDVSRKITASAKSKNLWGLEKL